MARRRTSDSAVADYQATIRYRLSVGVGRRVWSKVPATAVEEQVARVQWQQPNDLRVDVVGRRFRSREARRCELSSVWDRPWFVPRGVDDSVRIFSNDFPATGALHPLARTGPDWYRYALTGGLTVTPARGGALRLIRVQVTPRRTGPALIAGQLWIDSASAEVVRLTFRYLGTALWVRPEEGPRGPDSAKAARLNSLANRVVSIDADLEYGLQEGRYWMPLPAGDRRAGAAPAGERRRDPVSGHHHVRRLRDQRRPADRLRPCRCRRHRRLSRDSLRALRRARRDSLRPRAGASAPETPDSLRSWDYAGRWRGRPVRAAPAVQRRRSDRYREWPDSLSLEADPAEARRMREAEAELARLAEALARLGDRAGGRTALAYERLSDALRYDRVQGLSFGLGYRVRVPGVRFTNLYGTVRYGLSDDRVTGRLTLRARRAWRAAARWAGTATSPMSDPFSAGPHGGEYPERALRRAR